MDCLGQSAASLPTPEPRTLARGVGPVVSLEPPPPGSPVTPLPPQAHLVRRHTAPPSTPSSREHAAPFLAGRITCGAAVSPAHSSAADWSPLWTSPTSESDAARERRGRLRAVGRSAAARLPGGEGGTESASSRLAEEVDARQQAAMAAADAAVARLHAELAQEEADSQRRREKLKEQAAAAAASEAHERALQALTAGDTLALALALSLTLALAVALAVAAALALALALAQAQALPLP